MIIVTYESVNISSVLEVDPRAQGLIFDLDGTLVDTMNLHLAAWKEVGRQNGFEYPEELFYRLAGIPTRNIVPIVNAELGLALDVDAATRAKEEAFLRHLHLAKPLEPVVMLAKKYAGKMPIAIGTGNTRTLTERILEASGLAGFFSVIVTADDVEHHKPHPETFLRCANLLNVPPELCQVFEDGEQGLEAARRAGMIATDVRPYVVKKVKCGSKKNFT